MYAVENSSITSPRLTLKPVSRADIPAIVSAANDLEVARWMSRLPHPYTADDAEVFVAKNEGNAGRVWGIHDADGFVGVVGIVHEFGYWLARRAWGKGYATEAGKAVLGAYFANPSAVPLQSNHFTENGRSARVLNKLGFGYTGKSDETTCRATGVAHTRRMMTLVPEQWHALNPLIIETLRLTLRPVIQADAEVLSAIAGVQEVAPMLMSIRAPWAIEDARRWIEQSRWRGRPGFRLAITLKDGTVIGTVGIGPAARGISTMYFIGTAHWGQGYATEAMQAFLGAVFKRFAPECVIADHFDDNPASGRVLRKLGFEKTGEDVAGSAARLEPAPVSLYRVNRSQFEAQL
ncbi:GNAT family N-acetyltransferase [Actibacterium lipolyticum]|uniref:Anhydro-N-acetylmuramic acid kinase n=1 Tax=Actibacterium lipolyticum TaxID=1524263 RepID=A0A238JYP7_9RHOB|nr:GNAT family N-acetyltransferase [Actibacterium lipolyticum]SMX35244.1 anhydro-N-acetylmuramic acid kinase [Actibacterium lipolyticum]